MPGLRGLRDPRRGAGVHARARPAAREDRLHLRDRLRRALPVLHADVRAALDPRACAGDRDRSLHVASGPVRLGRDRRRRRALDRRQPPDPRAPPEREREDPALQQPDLRPDEGPVLADLAARDAEQVDADGLARLPVQPGLDRDRRGGDLRRALDRHRQEAPDRGAAARGEPQGVGARRDLPELQRLQRRRLRRGQGADGEPDPARARGTDHVRRGERAWSEATGGRLVRARRGRRGRTSSSTTSTRRSGRSRSRSRGSRTRRTARRRSGSSETSSARSTTS